MQTTIDNSQRVFLIHGTGWNSQKYFCNMADLVKCAKEFEVNQPYVIYHFWNNKPVKLSPKKVIELLQANQLDATFFMKKKDLPEWKRAGYNDEEAYLTAKYAAHG